MKTGHNDLFRFVSVRGPEPIYTVDPTGDLVDVEVIETLGPLEVDLANPDPKIPTLLAGIAIWTAQDIAGSALAAARTAIDSAAMTRLAGLRAVAIPLPDGSTPATGLFARSTVFHAEYRALTNSWLTLLLTNPTSADLSEHEDLLQVAHLIHLVAVDPALLAEGTAVTRARSAEVVPPSVWLPEGKRASRLRARQGAALTAQAGSVAPSALKAKITAAKSAHGELVRKRELLESIQAKSDLAYRTWKKDKLPAGDRPVRAARPPRRRGLFPWSNRTQPEVSPTRRVGQPLLRLDAAFFGQLNTLLTEPERALYQTIRTGLPQPETHADHDVGIAPDRYVGEANHLCHQIRVWEDEQRTQLPETPPTQPGTERPLVRSVGWGELVVARERLLRYEAREIAHVENVMPGEKRLREHERTRRVEEVEERETVEETESERDVATTSRYEMQLATETTIQEDYSIDAGLNTSGKYGLTHVNTSLQAGVQLNKSEARSSSQQLAQEIVTKAVERTFERVRELRRRTVTEQIRELNRHGFDNVQPPGGGAATDISGIFVWVEKLLEVELRHYGTRMLVEFYLPEPAVSLLEADRNAAPGPRKPAPFSLSPSDVLPENYMCLTSTFGAQDIQPPPAPYIQVGYAWATTPNEDIDKWAQDVRADYIAIPNGYRPIAMTALVSAHPGSPENIDVFMAMGGEVVVEMAGVNYGESGQVPGGEPSPGGPVEISLDPALSWPAGVPVVVRAAGHFDNTLVAEATVRCVRTAQALDEWRLQTWERLRAAHDVLVQTYERQQQQIALETFAATPVVRPESENRRVETEELRKWAIKAMRLETFAFNGIRTEADGAQEIDPTNGDLVATVARFFEEAFEWPQASYFLYPYYWARRSTWQMRAALDAVEARHAAFLRAGAARYIVPVTPGYESRVIRYLEGEGKEIDRLGAPPGTYSPTDLTLKNLWLELLLDRRPELAVGSGTLDVQANNAVATINADSNWQATERDRGRELYIDGDLYAIVDIAPYQEGVGQQITLDEVYKGTSDVAASYATGTVPYGPPWVERVPTSLIILSGRRPDLTALST